MAEFKLVISDPKKGKSYQKEVKEKEASSLVGLKIGSKVSGDKIELAGYEFEISGGSDNCGFPMRKDLEGTARKKILIVGGVGLHSKRKGMKKRKTVAGNTISNSTSQINMKILKYGKAELETPSPKPETKEGEGEVKEGKEKKVEEKKEEVKEEKKTEDKKEEIKEEKKKEKTEKNIEDKKEVKEEKIEEKKKEVKEETKEKEKKEEG